MLSLKTLNVLYPTHIGGEETKLEVEDGTYIEDAESGKVYKVRVSKGVKRVERLEEGCCCAICCGKGKELGGDGIYRV